MRERARTVEAWSSVCSDIRARRRQRRRRRAGHCRWPSARLQLRKRSRHGRCSPTTQAHHAACSGSSSEAILYCAGCSRASDPRSMSPLGSVGWEVAACPRRQAPATGCPARATLPRRNPASRFSPSSCEALGRPRRSAQAKSIQALRGGGLARQGSKLARAQCGVGRGGCRQVRWQRGHRAAAPITSDWIAPSAAASAHAAPHPHARGSDRRCSIPAGKI